MAATCVGEAEESDARSRCRRGDQPVGQAGAATVWAGRLRLTDAGDIEARPESEFLAAIRTVDGASALVSSVSSIFVGDIGGHAF